MCVCEKESKFYQATRETRMKFLWQYLFLLDRLARVTGPDLPISFPPDTFLKSFFPAEEYKDGRMNFFVNSTPAFFYIKEHIDEVSDSLEERWFELIETFENDENDFEELTPQHLLNTYVQIGDLAVELGVRGYLYHDGHTGEPIISEDFDEEHEKELLKELFTEEEIEEATDNMCCHYLISHKSK